MNLTPGPPASLTVLLPQPDQSASGPSNLFNAIQSNNKHHLPRNQHHSDNVAFQKTQRQPAQEQVRNYFIRLDVNSIEITFFHIQTNLKHVKNSFHFHYFFLSYYLDTQDNLTQNTGAGNLFPLLNSF